MRLVAKLFFYLILITPFLGSALFTNELGTLLSFLITTYMSIFWFTAYVYLCDLIAAAVGQSSPYMTEFYFGIRTDLLVSAFVGTTFAFFFWITPPIYSRTNLDFAAAGVPFLVWAIVETMRSGRIKIGQSKLPRNIVIFLALIQGLVYCASFVALAYVWNGNASSIQSMWIQVTIFSASFTFFFGAKQIRFILTKKHMEISPTILCLFGDTEMGRELCKRTQTGIDLWNLEVKKELTKQRRQKQSLRGKKRRRL